MPGTRAIEISDARYNTSSRTEERLRYSMNRTLGRRVGTLRQGRPNVPASGTTLGGCSSFHLSQRTAKSLSGGGGSRRFQNSPLGVCTLGIPANPGGLAELCVCAVCGEWSRRSTRQPRQPPGGSERRAQRGDRRRAVGPARRPSDRREGGPTGPTDFFMRCGAVAVGEVVAGAFVRVGWSL